LESIQPLDGDVVQINLLGWVASEGDLNKGGNSFQNPVYPDWFMQFASPTFIFLTYPVT
jgi:hypothetical protein